MLCYRTITRLSTAAAAQSDSAPALWACATGSAPLDALGEPDVLEVATEVEDELVAGVLVDEEGADELGEVAIGDELLGVVVAVGVKLGVSVVVEVGWGNG